MKKLLEGVAHIIHAGDVGSPQVLAELRSLAPVTAVRGNCDYETWAQVLPLRAELELGGARILVGHMPAQTRHWAATAAQRGGRPAFAAVIFGHSHAALVERADGVLYLNPGAAGPKRFNRPRTVARLLIVPAGAGTPGGRGFRAGRGATAGRDSGRRKRVADKKLPFSEPGWGEGEFVCGKEGAALPRDSVTSSIDPVNEPVLDLLTESH